MITERPRPTHQCFPAGRRRYRFLNRGIPTHSCVVDCFHPLLFQVYHQLKSVIKDKYGQDACNVGDEGGFAPNIQSNLEGIELLMAAIKKAGYEDKVSKARGMGESWSGGGGLGEGRIALRDVFCWKQRFRLQRIRQASFGVEFCERADTESESGGTALR